MAAVFARKPNNARYIAVSAVAIVLAILWAAMPASERAGGDVRPARFKGRAVSLRNIDVRLEGQAAGMPLTGEITNNPTRQPLSGSSLYGVSDGAKFEEAAGKDAGAAAATAQDALKEPPAPSADAAAAPSSGGAAPAPASHPAAKKLSSVPALSGASGGATSGAPVSGSKFFGSGNGKAELEAATRLKGDVTAPGGGRLMASLQKTENISSKAAKDGDKGAAVGAFEGGNRLRSDLNGALEKGSARSGAELSDVEAQVASLKTNDPTLNSVNIKAPTPPLPQENMKDKQAEMIKMMIIQMAIQSILGPVFGSVGQMISGAAGTSMGSGVNSSWSGGQ
ncbi:MAG: hypothetical protein PHP45_00430 [Elusimicrobiales bacterium]|nr:hypothetical protein [Elusimicrobiales bacterium]